MIVLGVDPGIATTGYALVADLPGETPELIRYGAIRTPAGKAMSERLHTVYLEITEVIAGAKPGAVAIEELFFKRNVSSALTVGQARGVVMLAAAQANLTVFEYKPAQIKQSLVGYGAADKRQVQEMLRMLLSLPSVPKPDDAADAIAVALCHLANDRLRRLIA